MEKIDEVLSEDNGTVESPRRISFRGNIGSTNLQRQASYVSQRASLAEAQEIKEEEEVSDPSGKSKDQGGDAEEDPMAAVREMLKKQAEMRAKLFARQQAALAEEERKGGDDVRFFEYELESNHDEEEVVPAPQNEAQEEGQESAPQQIDRKKKHQYDYENTRFLEPDLVQMPDGRMMIAIKSTDESFSKIMCWNCKSVLLYRQQEFSYVRCYSCQSKVNTSYNNKEERQIVSCELCRTDLLVPSGVFKVSCGACGGDFEVSKIVNQAKVEPIHFFSHNQ